MADCCEESRRVMTSASDMFVVVDDDFDAVTRNMSFRRCPVIRPVHGLRRSFLQRSSTTIVDSRSPKRRTSLDNFSSSDGMTYAVAVDNSSPRDTDKH